MEIAATGSMNLQTTGIPGKGAGNEVNDIATFGQMWLIFTYDLAWELIFHQFFRYNHRTVGVIH